MSYENMLFFAWVQCQSVFIHQQSDEVILILWLHADKAEGRKLELCMNNWETFRTKSN